jgi:hypothetical protein
MASGRRVRFERGQSRSLASVPASPTPIPAVALSEAGFRLDPAVLNLDQLGNLLKAPPEDFLDSYPVNPKLVNSALVDTPECVNCELLVSDPIVLSYLKVPTDTRSIWIRDCPPIKSGAKLKNSGDIDSMESSL